MCGLSFSFIFIYACMTCLDDHIICDVLNVGLCCANAICNTNTEFLLCRFLIVYTDKGTKAHKSKLVFKKLV